MCLSVRERKADADWGGRARRVARHERESRSGRAAQRAEPASTSPTTSSFQHERGTWTPIRVSRFTSVLFCSLTSHLRARVWVPKPTGKTPGTPAPQAPRGRRLAADVGRAHREERQLVLGSERAARAGVRPRLRTSRPFSGEAGGAGRPRKAEPFVLYSLKLRVNRPVSPAARCPNDSPPRPSREAGAASSEASGQSSYDHAERRIPCVPRRVLRSSRSKREWSSKTLFKSSRAARPCAVSRRGQTSGSLHPSGVNAFCRCEGTALPGGLLPSRPESQVALITVHSTNRSKMFHCKIFVSV